MLIHLKLIPTSFDVGSIKLPYIMLYFYHYIKLYPLKIYLISKNVCKAYLLTSTYRHYPPGLEFDSMGIRESMEKVFKYLFTWFIVLPCPSVLSHSCFTHRPLGPKC